MEEELEYNYCTVQNLIYLMQYRNTQVEVNCCSIPCEAEECMLQGITYYILHDEG